MLRGYNSANNPIGIMVCAFGDNPNYNMKQTFITSSQNQIQLVPFVKYPSGEDLNYTPSTYYIPVGNLYSYGSEFESNFIRFTCNEVSYISNGFWAIREEG